jgi:hypothetical protein
MRAMRRLLLTRPVLKVLVVFAAIAAFCVIVYLMSGLPAPRERDRIAHVAGTFSIIKPRDWDGRVVYGPIDKTYVETIDITPAKSIGRTQKLFVGRLRHPPDVAELKSKHRFVESQFQQRPALLFSGAVKEGYVWRTIFQRGDDWYEIGLRLQVEEDVPRSDWWAYVNSFRAEEKPATSKAD